MSFNHESEVDLEQAASFLKDALNKVMTEENPDLLNDLKRVFKKTIPFSKRLYVAAFLVKEMQGRYRGHQTAGRSERTSRDNNWKERNSTHDRIRNDRSHDTKQQKEVRTADTTPIDESHNEEHFPRPRVQIDESLAATIFISIGRNRRVYPRDLVGLLVSIAGLDRDRIGDIRVLANYSFVQLFKDDTEKAISTLNGYDYRGRKLAVSYSRQKGDEADDAEENTADKAEINSSENHSGDPQIAAEDAKAYAAAEKAAADKEPFTTPSHISSDESEVPASAENNSGYLV
ncbi:MAG: DbpA RNA binding domain-containing protein [Treponema sp.]|nr:DbpA RNA binding domain-containing protein [Treponema sp.]